MELANAIARLERAGSENSKSHAKLVDASKNLSCWIAKHVPVGVTLPRGYEVVRIRSNVGSDLFLVRDWESDEAAWIDGYDGYLHGDFSCFIPAATRSDLLQLARDVAQGWLTEVAEFLEKRAAKSVSSANTITSAIDSPEA